jgi:PKHD-type hydroxylase
MQALRQAYIEPFVVADSGFNDTQMDQIIDLGAASIADQGRLADGQAANNARTCTLSWLYPSHNTQWIFDAVFAGLSKINNQYYGFALDQYEPLQFTNYNQDRAEFYAPHLDIVYGMKSSMTSRKLSLVIQLTDPSTYEGGDLLMHVGREKPLAVPRQRGAMVVFPSFMLHEVTPVSKGRRNSLVTWAHGPLFK